MVVEQATELFTVATEIANLIKDGLVNLPAPVPSKPRPNTESSEALNWYIRKHCG